ncbi:hypothetical protein OSB04_023891 [Centaurea solstitialis]|uniref:Uncharacterized protein n=1 Tax=Centaurea solstitialis TaxID=347529 RepID=A0AA38SK27_9ASTR|nr:hypothetical protein OSB04_023891 [Centaurea solstitialis]
MVRVRSGSRSGISMSKAPLLLFLDYWCYTHNPTCIYEDNAACIEQMKVGYIKGDNTKHISPKFFYNQQQQTLLKIQVNQVSSEENVADLFTKSLPKVTFEKHVESIGMKRLSKLP